MHSTSFEKNKTKYWLAIKYFVQIWVGAGIILWLLPIQSRFGDVLKLIIFVFLFVFLICFTAVLWLQKTPVFRVKHIYNKSLPYCKLVYIIKMSAVATLLGNGLILFERIFIRGISYEDGLRAARYQWLAAQESGTFISVFGNILVPFSYAALFMGIFHWEKIKRKEKILSIATGLGGQVLLAMLNGGRSNILSAIIFAFTVCVIRKYSDKSFLPKVRGKLPVFIVCLFALIKYLESIFFAFTENDITFLKMSIEGLGADLDSDYQDNPITNLFIEISLYVLHGVYFSSAVLENSGFDFADINHNMSLRGIMVLLARFPFVNYQMELPSFDGGGGTFVALPGVLLYDYGWIGFFITTIMLGVLFGEAIKRLKKCNTGLGVIELFFCIAVLMHVYFSVVDMMLGFGYFIFIILGLYLSDKVSSMKYGDSCWTKLQE